MIPRLERKGPIALFSISEFSKQNRKQPKQEGDEDKKHSRLVINTQDEESVVRYILGLTGKRFIAL